MNAHDELGIELALGQAGGDFSTKYRLMKSRLLEVEYEHWAAGFPEGNSHGRSHIQRVLAYLDLMLGKDPLQHLSVYELFLTMMSILYHDVGILRARKGHPEISKQLLEDDQNDAYVINKIDKEIIAAAVVSHSSSKDIAKECARFSSEEIVGKHRARPTVVAALVRLADELDEDHRRADPILQVKLGPPATSEFFWRFCRRVRGVRPDLVAKRIDFNMAFEPDDTTYCGTLPGGAIRHFVAFSADKLAKINSERVLVNRFLPPELQYGGLHVDMKPLAGHAKWSAPRTFVFNDKTSAEMFLGSFPELLAEPALLMLQDVLGLMKDGELVEADGRLDRLLGWGNDLPVDVKVKALYEKLCVASLAAGKAGKNSAERDPWLDRGVSATREWLDVGNAGAFQASGRTADAELHRLVHDLDCRVLLKERLQQLPLPVQSAVAKKKSPSGGGSGCVPLGSSIRTPDGWRPVESLGIGDAIVATRLEGRPSQVRTVITAIATARSSCCLQVNTDWSVTPAQPVYTEQGWVTASELKPGDRVADDAGQWVPVSAITLVDGYFEVFDLTVSDVAHNYSANGLLCHNKSPLPDPGTSGNIGLDIWDGP